MEGEHAKKQPKFVKLATILPGHHGYNVYCKVLDSKITTVKRADGTELKIAEGTVGDDSAIIKFRVAGDYAKEFIPDQVVAIRNGRSDVFKERHRLELDRWGKVTVEKDHKIDSVNNSKDLSAVLYQTMLVSKDKDNKE